MSTCNGAASRYHRQWTQTGLTPGFTSTLLLNTHRTFKHFHDATFNTQKNIRYEEAGHGTWHKQGQDVKHSRYGCAGFRVPGAAGGPDVKSGRTFVRCGGDVRQARPSVWEERGVLGYLGNI